TVSRVVGVSVGQNNLSTVRLTADGAVTATAIGAGSTATGINASGSSFAPSNINTGILTVHANGDVSATSDGGATGIGLSRGSTRFAALTAG
ncbi:hypothetical protein AAEH85_21555, partial [Shewanella algae]